MSNVATSRNNSNYGLTQHMREYLLELEAENKRVIDDLLQRIATYFSELELENSNYQFEIETISTELENPNTANKKDLQYRRFCLKDSIRINNHKREFLEGLSKDIGDKNMIRTWKTTTLNRLRELIIELTDENKYFVARLSPNRISSNTTNCFKKILEIREELLGEYEKVFAHVNSITGGKKRKNKQTRRSKKIKNSL